MTGTLFAILTAANAMIAGQGIVSTIFLATVPVLRTLTKGSGWGLLRTASRITELIVPCACVIDSVSETEHAQPSEIDFYHLTVAVLGLTLCLSVPLTDPGPPFLGFV